MPLKVTIPGVEYYDEKNETFITTEPTVLTLEHSLVSVAKWESKWHKPFLEAKPPKTDEELLDYIRCMTITQNVDPEIYKRIPLDVIEQINAYIEDPMTATTFKQKPSGHPSVITSEVIYYQMIALGVPFECQRWHLTRLLTLLRVCNEKANPKKMSKRDILSQNSALNKARRAALKTRG